MPELSEFNTTSTKKDPDSIDEIALNIGYYASSKVNTGNVVLSNVSQAAVNSLIGNPAVALPTVELENSPMVHHVNYSAHQGVNLTIKGTGDTKLTLNGNPRGEDSLKSVYISGVKEINTDRSGHYYGWRLLVEEAYVVDNPSMKEAVIAFDARNVLAIANNPLLETIRLPDNHLSAYGNFTISNNTKLRMPAIFNIKTTDDTYRESDKTVAKFNWGGFTAKELHLDGNFSLDFFLIDDKNRGLLNDAVSGDVVINTTNPDFDCGKLVFNERKFRNENPQIFACNGETVVRSESLASRLLYSESCFLAALAVGIWSLL